MTVNTIMDQTDHFYARLDNYPATPGHVEIVPKRHVVSLFELKPSEMAEAYSLLHRVQAQLMQMYRPDGFTVGINEGRAAGRTIDHLHIHLIPRHFGDVDDPRGGIRQVLPNGDVSAWVKD